MGMPGRKRMVSRLLESQCGCFYCARSFGRGLGPTLDHFIPKIMGGRGRPGNLVLACWECNNLKAGYHPTVFILFLLLLVGSMGAGQR